MYIQTRNSPLSPHIALVKKNYSPSCFLKAFGMKMKEDGNQKPGKKYMRPKKIGGQASKG